jgi:hypothetical protein
MVLDDEAPSCMDDEIETASRYRAKADEVRGKAMDIKDLSIREMLLRIAVDYERMAEIILEIAKARNTRRGDTD